MPLLINQKLICNDPWQPLTEEQPLPENGHIILPLSRLCEEKERLNQSKLNLGVIINSDNDIAQVIFELKAIKTLKLVVIVIPAFTDGRAFSFACMLRRAGFQGEIRATGDVTRDRILFLKRCGFNAFEIPEARYSPEVGKAFTEVSIYYQGAADESKPIYRQMPKT